MQSPILWRYLNLLRGRIKVLLGMMVTAALVGGIFTFIEPRTYTARATFLTSAKGSAATSSISALTLAIKGGAGGDIGPDVIYHLIQSNRMAGGVAEHFRDDPRFPVARNLTKKRAHRMIDSFEVTEGSLMGVDATSTDPEFAKELANFCVDYLNIINEQMQLTTDKPMVRILDAAELPAGPNQRYTLQKAASAGFIIGLLGCLFFILRDYLSSLKGSERLLSVTEVLEEESFVSGDKRS